MSKIQLSNNHPFLTSGNDIAALCNPLLEQSGASQFVYGKYYDDGKCILLSNESRWVKHHLEHGYTAPAPIPTELLEKQQAYHLVPNDGPFHQAKHDLLHLFNSGEAIDMIFKHRHFYEVFCFAYPANHRSAVNAILNNLDNFKRFSSHFKQQACTIIKSSENNKLDMPSNMLGIDFDKCKTSISNPRQQHAFNFTNREIEISECLILGKSAREIADITGLSRRTIEHYLENMKNKTNSKSKSELITTIIYHYRNI